MGRDNVTKWFVGLSAAALLALLAAGCGGGGGGGSALSKADFISQGDAICTQAHVDEAKIDFPTVDPTTASDSDLEKFGDAIEQATEVDRKEVEDLRKLTPPEDFQDDWTEAMDELSEGLDHAEEAAAEANKHDAAGMKRELDATQAKANEANAKAKAYGLKVCGAS